MEKVNSNICYIVKTVNIGYNKTTLKLKYIKPKKFKE